MNRGPICKSTASAKLALVGLAQACSVTRGPALACSAPVDQSRTVLYPGGTYTPIRYSETRTYFMLVFFCKYERMYALPEGSLQEKVVGEIIGSPRMRKVFSTSCPNPFDLVEHIRCVYCNYCDLSFKSLILLVLEHCCVD